MPNEANVHQTEQIREIFDSADVVLLTDFQGLTVEEISELRNQLRAAGVHYKVCKNTLVNVVAQERGIEGLTPYLKGNTALATAQSRQTCLLYTSPSPRDRTRSRMPSSA